MTGASKLRVYRVADPGWRAGLNRYDYRPYGGERYTIGAYIVIGTRCLSLRWGRPGNNFGAEAVR